MGRLTDAFDAQQHTVQGPPCSVTILLRALPEEDRADLIAMFDSSRKSSHLAQFINTELHDEVVEALGGQLNEQALQRHRRGACHCGKTR